MAEYKGLPVTSDQYPLDGCALHALYSQFHSFLGKYPRVLVVRVSLKCSRLRMSKHEVCMDVFANKLQTLLDNWLRQHANKTVCKVSLVWALALDGRVLVSLWFNLEAFSNVAKEVAQRLIKDWVLKAWASAMMSWPEQIRYLVKYPNPDGFISIIPGSEHYRESISIAFYHMSSLTKQSVNEFGELTSSFHFRRGFTTWFGSKRHPQSFHCKRGNITLSPY